MPTKLVSMNTTAKRPKIIAAVPDICPVKYKTATTMAMTIRISLSMVPIFFFMVGSLFIRLGIE